MTINISEQSEKYLKELVKKLTIPVTRYEQAEKSYKSLGKWLHRADSTVSGFEPNVFIQGSFRLGTVVKPQSKDEEYDIDCGCSLTSLEKSQLTQQQLKELLGHEIKLYRDNKNITKPVQEARRCWTLEYADDAQFHMDVVPCLPNSDDQRKLLEAKMLDASFSKTAIAITDNERLDYFSITNDWPRSNPIGYAEWFKHRMGDMLTTEKNKVLVEMAARGVTASVEEIPVFRIQTPLQAAIMILKHHRNVMYENDTNNIKPISIIISTLSAHSYNGEKTIGSALNAILRQMDSMIERDGVKYIIRNPTDALENFADKWAEYPERADAFYDWLKQARHDFYSAAVLTEYQQISDVLAPNLGRTLTEQVNGEVLNLTPQNLLQAATAASSITAAASPAFANTPRVPKKPDGFA